MHIYIYVSKCIYIYIYIYIYLCINTYTYCYTYIYVNIYFFVIATGLHAKVLIAGTPLVEKDLFSFVFVHFMTKRNFLNKDNGFFSQPLNSDNMMTWQGTWGLYQLVSTTGSTDRALYDIRWKPCLFIACCLFSIACCLSHIGYCL